MSLWLKMVGYHQDGETLGKRSYGFIGAENASAAAGPVPTSSFKLGRWSSCPFDIFRAKYSKANLMLSPITDVAPTILDLAQISNPEIPPAGPMTGKI